MSTAAAHAPFARDTLALDEPSPSPGTRPNENDPGGAARAVARNAAASTLGASVVALLVTPLDVVKVRMQAHVCPVGGALPCVDPAHPAGAADAMRKIVRADGVAGLWRGVNATLALAVPTTGLYFTMYEVIRHRGDVMAPDLSPGLKALVSGAAARIVAATAASPLELARTALQAGAGGRDATVAGVLRDLYRERGLVALWRGLAPTLIRDVPFSAIYWSAYDALKDEHRSVLPKQIFRGHGERAVPLVAGIVAGSVAAMCTIPADVVKTRRQAGAAESTAGRGNVGQASISEIVRDIVRKEGVRGLFKGAAPRIAKVGPSCAIMMGSYELFRGWFGA